MFASFSWLHLGMIILITILLVLMILNLYGIIRGKRAIKSKPALPTIIFHILMGGIYFTLLIYCITDVADALPHLLPAFDGMNQTLGDTKGWLYVLGAFLYVYLLLEWMFPLKDRTSFVAITVLSIISGFGGAFIIVTINQAIQSSSLKWLSYFLFAVFVSVYGGRSVRMRLIEVTNRVILEKRTNLIRNILSSPYQYMESMDKGNIRVCLNNDTEVISQFAPTIISVITSAITLLGSFIYLGMLNFYALLLSIAIILVASLFYYWTSTRVRKDWWRNMEIHDQFFKYIDDLLYGFKELNLSHAKRRDFRKDIEQSCIDNYQTKVQGEFKFINVSLIGDLMFGLFIGTVVFLFPYLFSEIKEGYLVSFVFTFTYMSGQVTGLLGSLPRITMIRISWGRIKDTIQATEVWKQEEPTLAEGADNPCKAATGDIRLELNEVAYRYEREGDSPFVVGPVNYEFRSGEVVFITGGNGSGKSTLAKIITGLYVPDGGSIRLNGVPVGNRDLSEHFTAVFSDYYLFEKLYGVAFDLKREDIDYYLKLLQIEGKVFLQDGKFSTLNLSAGQRKRLALLVSYIEDAPIFLFDEWAADQDPEFRAFFYLELLPELKRRGKCIIAITHDDAYFHVSDRTIKMDSGQMLPERVEVGI